MIARQTIREIAAKLLAKTRAKQVKWLYSDENDSDCRLLLPHSSLEISFESPVAEPDRVTIRINRLEEDGLSLPITEITAEEGDEDWELFSALYNEASRIVYRWDQVLDELQSAVDTTGPIGKEYD